MQAINSSGLTQPEKVIDLETLSLTYESGNGTFVNALDNINLKIFEGEFVCLLGPSGCGKSTLLKIIAGFLAPSAGYARMDGKTIEGPEWHRGVVFQQPPLYPWLNVEDNVAFGLKMRKIAKEEAREITDKYLDLVKLKDFARQKPYEISGGMKQRVAIARVLVNNPRVLLMDEPFGALDALTRDQMQNLLRNIWWETRKTILFITHDVDEALSLGTRVLVMSKLPGKIMKEFGTSFTYHITGENSNGVRYSKEFQAIREEILDLINGQNMSFSI
jgi:taurine transport system ATP-binding protein